MTKRFLPLLLLIALAAFACQPRSESVVTLTILHNNDLHGALLPGVTVNADGSTHEQGGFLTLSRYIAKFRAENPNRTLLFNTGDWFQGTPEGNESKGEGVVDLFNALHYDAAALGNHEFDFDLTNLQRIVRTAQFPVLAYNVEQTATQRRPDWLAHEYWQQDIDGIRIIAFGLLTKEVATTTAGDIRGVLTVSDEREATRYAVAALRGKCDILICLSHSGMEVDKQLAAEFPELDVILGGHSHSYTEVPYVDAATGVIVVQAGGKNMHLGKLDLDFDRATRRLAGFRGELVPLLPDAAGLPDADPAFVARLARWTGPVAQRMAEVFGTATTPLTRRDLGPAPASSTLGNWLCDVMRQRSGADIAFHNRTGIRAEIPAGPVTARHLYEVSPFGNEIAVVTLTGAQVKQVLAYALSGQRYFLETSGITVRYTAGPEVGTYTVREVLVGGQPLRDRASYRVATNDFIAAGGDGHTTFAAGRRVGVAGKKLLAATEETVYTAGSISGPADNRYVRAQ